MDRLQKKISEELPTEIRYADLVLRITQFLKKATATPVGDIKLIADTEGYDNPSFELQAERWETDDEMVERQAAKDRHERQKRADKARKLASKLVPVDYGYVNDNEVSLDFGEIQVSTTKKLAENFKSWVRTNKIKSSSRYHIEMTPTGLGTKTVFKHSSGKEFDLTPYEWW